MHRPQNTDQTGDAMPRRSHYSGWACAVVLLAGSLAFSGRMSRRAIRNSSLEEIIRNDPAYYASTLQKGKATKAATSAEAASPPDDDEAASASALAASEAVSNARRVRQENTAVEEDGNGSGGRPDLEIVTAFSDNHALESVLMFQSLIRQQQGRRRHGSSGGFGDTRIGVYLMRRPEDQDEDGLSTQHTPLMLEYRRVLLESPLNVDVYDYVVEENYTTYCFKPKIVSDFLYGRGRYRSSWDGGDVRGNSGSNSTDSTGTSSGGNTGDRLPLPKVVMWADASTRYPADPNINARNMVKDGVYFAGKLGLKMGMGESTHDGTYSFFGMDRTRFRNRREISATHFLVNLMSPDVVSDVLLPYINCGTNACHRCMAPPGSSKYMDGRTIRGPPSTSYVAHRQDQSVLGLLVYDYMLHRNHTRNVVALDDRTYMHYAVSKTTKAKSVRDLLRDVVGGAGGSSGGAEKKK